MIFGLGRYSDTRWQFSQVSQYRGDACSEYGSDFVTYRALALDGAGNLYAVAGGGLDYWCGTVLNITSQTQLVGGYDPIFDNLTSDANGNLYGTISTCGFGGGAMVWQYSP
jgi:hypothetical protein